MYLGSLQFYTLTVSNAGPSIATNVVVSNTIPASVTFIQSTPSATPANGGLLVNLGSLAVGATKVAHIAIRPNVTGPLTNLFTVFSDETDPVPANNSAMVISTVTNAPPVTVLYTVVDLGDLGDSNSTAYAINNPGQIVGEASLLGGNSHAACWTNILNPPINLGSTNVTLGSQARSINNSGQIVGSFNEPAFAKHAAFWTNSASPPFDLGTLGGVASGALAINDSGSMVGYATLASGEAVPCFWTNSTSPPFNLGTLGGVGTISQANGINAAGQIAGQATTADGKKHAAFWTNSGSPVLALNDAASTNSAAFSINDLGQIVGNDDLTVVFWTNSASPPLALGTVAGYGYASQSSCINHSGQIVGSTEITNNFKANETAVATIWMSPTNPAQDLNYLIATNSGWILVFAYGINDSGVIVGSGLVTNAGAAHGYVQHAFALIPISQLSNSPPTLTINTPTNGEVVTNLFLEAYGTTTLGSSGAELTNVFYQLNNGGWTHALPTNYVSQDHTIRPTPIGRTGRRRCRLRPAVTPCKPIALIPTARRR